ncbi:MAG TPA: hypothetical protein VLD66_00030 [Methyloceanibacter sp.]|nr:hypothetical protein [Methyloceanibacter sp.]
MPTLVVPSAATLHAVAAEVGNNEATRGDITGVLALNLYTTLGQISTDLTALEAGTTITGVNGTTIGAGGALTTGQVLRATGAAAAGWGAVNLAAAAAVTGVLPSANMAAATAAAAGTVTLVQQMGAMRTVRGVVDANVADLNAFTVAGNDGLTYAAGERLALVNQSTASQDGIYVVGTVGGGTAPLTRATDYAASSVQPAGLEIGVNEGTLWGGTKWFASLAGAITVGTSSPAFYPRRYVRVTTAMSGTPGTSALSAEWILSTTKSNVNVTVITPGTQGFLSRGALTAGAGTGSFTITSTANETSTLQVVIEN